MIAKYFAIQCSCIPPKKLTPSTAAVGKDSWIHGTGYLHCYTHGMGQTFLCEARCERVDRQSGRNKVMSLWNCARTRLQAELVKLTGFWKTGRSPAAKAARQINFKLRMLALRLCLSPVSLPQRTWANDFTAVLYRPAVLLRCFCTRWVYYGYGIVYCLFEILHILDLDKFIMRC